MRYVRTFGRENQRLEVVSPFFVCFSRVGQNHIYIYGVYKVLLAGKSPNVRSYTVYIYGFGQHYVFCIACLFTPLHVSLVSALRAHLPHACLSCFKRWSIQHLIS